MEIGVLVQILAIIAAGASVYAAIKSDLTKAIVTAENAAKSAESCHDRMDTHINLLHTKGGQ